MPAPGQIESQKLIQAGFTPQEVYDWQTEEARKLSAAGFSPEEIDAHFGTTEPDISSTIDSIANNLKKNLEPEIPGTKEPGQTSKQTLETQEPREITFAEAVEAGFDMSVGLDIPGVGGFGLMNEAPDKFLPDNAPMFYRIASQMATVMGDLPAMAYGAFAGGAVGGAVGSAVPVVGNVLGAGLGAAGGAFALPQAMRESLMQHYEKGDIVDFQDFWSRTSATFIEGAKGFGIGAATFGAAGTVGRVMAPLAVPPVVKTSATLSTEIATMTTLGAAFEGHAPEAQDFIDAAIVLGGLKIATKAPKYAKKLRDLYAKTGKNPGEIVEIAESNPAVKQAILSEKMPIDKIAEKIGIPEGQRPLKVPLREKIAKGKERVAETGKEMYRDLVDRFDPINDATKVLEKKSNKTFTDAENPYVLARTAVDAKAKVKHMLESGTIDFKTLETTGKPLRAILEKVDNIKDFEAYLVSKRVLEKTKQGKETGFDPIAAKEVVRQNKARFEKQAQEFVEFNNQVLKYAKDSGLLSEASYKKMIELNKDYVPFKRVFEATELAEGKGRGKLGQLKEFKGSERNIKDPINSVVDNMIELVQAAEANRARVKMVEQLENVGVEGLAAKVKTPMSPTKVSAQEVAKALDLPIEQVEAFTIFRPRKKDLAPNQFEVYRKGKREVWETTPELAEALKAVGGDGTAQNMLIKFARGVTTVKKIGITFLPEFNVRNMIRDLTTSSVLTKKSITPVDVVASMRDLITRNKNYETWLKSGGANGAFLELDAAYISKNITRLQKQTGFMESARNVVRSPFDVMRVAAEVIEQAPRLAEFKKVTGGSKEVAKLLEGGIASREITIDFQRMGAKMSAMNSITAFLNVSVQGVDRTVRAIKTDPKGVSLKAAGLITVPSVLLWWAQRDDPRYQEVPRWEKDMFWIITTDKWENASDEDARGLPEYLVRNNNGQMQINRGTTYRIPKPMELGIIFGSLPERVLEAYFTENPKAWKDFSDTIARSLTPSIIPDAVSPVIEQYFNQSFFTGRDIVPSYLEEVEPRYQHVNYTSESAKQLGKLIGAVAPNSELSSPMIIENYIRSWTGGLGRYAVQAADQLLIQSGTIEDPVKPSATMSDVPFVKSFVVRYPTAGAESLSEFYDSYKEGIRFEKTAKLLEKRQEIAELEDYMKNGEMLAKVSMLKAINQTLADNRQILYSVYLSKDLSRDEKRQFIDTLYHQMIETAKMGNEQIREIEKSFKESE